LAEEAVGLVKSIDWNLCKGPNWETKSDNQHSESEDEQDELVQGIRNELEPPTFDIDENYRLFKKERI
jgi:hypothetical protein